MKNPIKLLVLFALLLVPLALVACGDDDDGDGQTSDVQPGDNDGDSFVSAGGIRTSKGLTAAAQNAGFGSNNVSGDDGAEFPESRV